MKKWLAEHPEEEQFKHQFLDKNPSQVLFEIGIRKGHVVLDHGCGSGTYTIPAAKLVGDEGKVYALDEAGSSFRLLGAELINGYLAIGLEAHSVPSAKRRRACASRPVVTMSPGLSVSPAANATGIREP